MKSEILEKIRKGQCMLLLGAGASYGSKDIKQNEILMGEGLSELLCLEIKEPYSPGLLAKVYGIAKDELGSKLIKILEERFRNIEPSIALNMLAKHIWPRIYSLNIDDATENAFRKKSPQKISLRTAFDHWEEIDKLHQTLNIIKLNGCISRPADGFIFSPSEYAFASNNTPEWYKQLGRDYLNYTFIFIGTKLDEPLFYQQIEYYKSTWKGTPGQPGKAYVITPSASTLEVRSLATHNIEHISGTLESFVQWLDSEIDNNRTPMDVALERNPEISMAIENSHTEDLSKIAKVSAIRHPPKDVNHGKTKEFYLGFKPTWDEIFTNVPARLSFHKALEKITSASDKLCVLTGPAGSGKTTALMMYAADLAHAGHTVYYLKEPIANLESPIRQLEKINKKPYYFFIDRASSVLDGIRLCLEDKNITNAIFICGERLNVWRRRTEWALSEFKPKQISTSDISADDAILILEHLEQHGPWSKIARHTPEQRKTLLLSKSKRQLLIGLLELTYGFGFEQIIEDDFKRLHSEDAQLLLVLVGLATVHSLSLPMDMCLAALDSLGIKTHINTLLNETHGVIHQHGDLLRARHPVYVDKLFDGMTPLSIKERAIRGLLMSLTRHKKPISKNMSRSELMLFKLTINHNFLANHFHKKQDLILKVFEDHEKFFELDGLYYLQFGLALRDMDKHPEALRKLEYAVDAWRMKQTEHAYAHQLLLCALAETKERAYRNLQEAEEILLRLDSDHSDEDTDYPLVTLAKYHVQIFKKYESNETTINIINRYIQEISDRQRRGRRNYRLEEAKVELLKHATSHPKTSRISPPKKSLRLP